MQKEKTIKIQQGIIPEFISESSTPVVTQQQQAWKTLNLINNETPYKDFTGRGLAVKAAVQGLTYFKTHQNVGQALPDNKIDCHAEKSLLSISSASQKQGRDPEQQQLRMTHNFTNSPSTVPVLQPTGQALTGHLPPHGKVDHFNVLSTWRERVAGGRMRGNVKDEALNKNTFRAPLRSGFTLIELLVVVLIIGILAAVALPQYQMAVLKSRMVEMQTITKQIKDAEEIYFMEHGSYTHNLRDLSVDFLDAQKPGNDWIFPSGITILSSEIEAGPRVYAIWSKYNLGFSWYLDQSTRAKQGILRTCVAYNVPTHPLQRRLCEQLSGKTTYSVYCNSTNNSTPCYSYHF